MGSNGYDTATNLTILAATLRQSQRSRAEALLEVVKASMNMRDETGGWLQQMNSMGAARRALTRLSTTVGQASGATRPIYSYFTADYDLADYLTPAEMDVLVTTADVNKPHGVPHRITFSIAHDGGVTWSSTGNETAPAVETMAGFLLLPYVVTDLLERIREASERAQRVGEVLKSLFDRTSGLAMAETL